MTARVLLSIFATFKVGGPQVRFASLANHMGSRFRHVIVAMDNQFDCKDRLDPGLDVTLHALSYRKASTLANLRLFRSLLRQIHPDVLVTHNWGSIEWAMANWSGVVRHVHIEDGFGPEEADRQLPRRVLMRRIFLRGSHVVVASRKLEQIATGIWKLPPRIVQHIPNGIDCSRFAQAGLEPLLPPGPPTIGTVAALRREKNLPRLLEAFALVRRGRACRLVIAGDGPERGALEAQAYAMGLRDDVIFTGYRSNTERVYAGLKVFALSSDTEQMPISVIEAMAAGLPVASTDVGDVRAMVCPENREFVRGLDAGELAKSLIALLDAPGRIGVLNQAVAREKFSQEKMFASYEALFAGAPPAS